MASEYCLPPMTTMQTATARPHDNPPIPGTQTGLQHIAALLQDIYNGSVCIEDPTVQPLMEPSIFNTGEEAEGLSHRARVRSPSLGIILLYTDGSKSEHGTTASVWHCFITNNLRPTILFEGNCSIWNKTDLEDSKIHAIQEKLRALQVRGTSNEVIHLCVDNQNAPQALSRET